MNQYGSNGAKLRFDGGGTEFGFMHRDLGSGYLMFDVDRLHVKVEEFLKLRNENECFVEYRDTGEREKGVQFIAMFEVKHKRSHYTLKALDPENSVSYARLCMAQKLGCRLFVVYASGGRQPFDFWEIDTTDGGASLVGTLEYNKADRRESVQQFWKEVLEISS